MSCGIDDAIKQPASSHIPADQRVDAGLAIATLRSEFNASPIAEQMRHCHHAYDENHPHPYHLEDDVRTHTDMVTDSMEHLIDQVPMAAELQVAAMAVAQGHDIGKIRARETDPETLKASFKNHANISQLAFYEFVMNTPLGPMMIEDGTLYPTLLAIGYHDSALRDLYAEEKPSASVLKKWQSIFYYNPELFPLLALMNKADDLGRISDPSVRGTPGTAYQQLDERNQMYPRPARDAAPILAQPTHQIETLRDGILAQPSLIVMTGLPGSGKSTALRQLFADVPPEDVLCVGLDDFTAQVAAEYGIPYNEVFASEFRDEILYEADARYLAKIESRFQDGRLPRYLVFDRTHTTQKNRGKSLTLAEQFIRKAVANGSELPAYRNVSFTFLTPPEQCIERAKHRDGNTVRAGVIRMMERKMLLPLYGERLHSNAPTATHSTYQNVVVGMTTKNGAIYQEYSPGNYPNIRKKVNFGHLFSAFFA